MKTFHMSVNISGVLSWPDRELLKLFDPDGRPAAEAIRQWLREQQNKGVVVLPFGPPCKGWSDLTGCPGHQT